MLKSGLVLSLVVIVLQSCGGKSGSKSSPPGNDNGDKPTGQLPTSAPSEISSFAGLPELSSFGTFKEVTGNDAPSPRVGPTLATNGALVLVAGGCTIDSNLTESAARNTQHLADGFLYSVSTDSWRTISPPTDDAKLFETGCSNLNPGKITRHLVMMTNTDLVFAQRNALVFMNLQSGAWRKVALPTVGGLSSIVALTDGIVARAESDYLRTYRFDGSKLQEVKLVDNAKYILSIGAPEVYVTTDSLKKIDLASGAVQSLTKPDCGTPAGIDFSGGFGNGTLIAARMQGKEFLPTSSFAKHTLGACFIHYQSSGVTMLPRLPLSTVQPDAKTVDGYHTLESLTDGAVGKDYAFFNAGKRAYATWLSWDEQNKSESRRLNAFRSVSTLDEAVVFSFAQQKWLRLALPRGISGATDSSTISLGTKGFFTWGGYTSEGSETLPSMLKDDDHRPFSSAAKADLLNSGYIWLPQN